MQIILRSVKSKNDALDELQGALARTIIPSFHGSNRNKIFHFALSGIFIILLKCETEELFQMPLKFFLRTDLFG